MFAKYLLPIAAGVALLCGAAAGVQTFRLHQAQDKLDAEQAEVGRLRIAAAGSEETITKLRDALESFRRAAVADATAVAAAARAVETYRGVLKAQADRLAELEAKDYDKPDCQALLDADLASLCPAHADGVRQRAAGGLSGPTG